MTWWAWVIAGAIFLGAELGFISAQFYLVFIGVSAIAVGVIDFFVPSLAAWALWALFAAFSLVTLTAFRRAIYERLKNDLPHAVRSGPAGDVLTLPARLLPGDSCQVEYRGSHWTVTNGSADTIDAGARARIGHVQGLALIVRPDN